MTIDAARVGLRVREVELPLGHRATGPRPRWVRSPRAAAARHRLRLRAARRSTSTACVCRSSAGSGRDERARRVAAVAALGLADDLWSGQERGFRAHLRSRSDDRRPQAGRHPAVGLLATRAGLRSAARRPRRERAQPARHASRSRAQGLSRCGRSSGRAGRCRRPAPSLRSPRDGDARGRGVERAGRTARLAFREAIHGTRPVVGDRRADRLSRSSENDSPSAPGSSRPRCSRGSIDWAGHELTLRARRSTSSSRAASSRPSAKASSPRRSGGC